MSITALDPIQRPVLAELTRVYEGLSRDEGGSELERNLALLMLSCYQDVDGRFWFGMDAPDFPDHDRWIATVSMDDFTRAGRSWHKVYFSNVLACGSLMTYGERLDGNLVEDFAELAKEFQDAAKALQDPAEVACRGVYQARQLKRLEIYQAFNTFNYDGLEEAQARLTWDQDLHDLIRHYDTFQANHPECAGLPHDLALRMHGLGTYVDARAGGDDWLDPHQQLRMALS
jgi:hypothetical protein